MPMFHPSKQQLYNAVLQLMWSFTGDPLERKILRYNLRLLTNIINIQERRDKLALVKLIPLHGRCNRMYAKRQSWKLSARRPWWQNWEASVYDRFREWGSIACAHKACVNLDRTEHTRSAFLQQRFSRTHVPFSDDVRTNHDRSYKKSDCSTNFELKISLDLLRFPYTLIDYSN